MLIVAMKPMTALQQGLDQQIAQVTSVEKMLPLVLAEAARRIDLNVSELEIQLLSCAILDAKQGAAQLDIDPPCGFGATEGEIRANIERLKSNLGESLPRVTEQVTAAISDAVPEAIFAAAAVIGSHLSDNAAEHMSQLSAEHAKRAKTVQKLWGLAFDQLDFLRHIVLEWSHEAHLLRSGPYLHPNTAFALNRLVGRAYEIVGEIITLARSGYADGALARWRSLHEVCVIALFLARHSDRCALMYLSHHQVEELKILEVDRASGRRKTIGSVEDRYVAHLRRQKAVFASKFGAAFVNDYGWASVELGRAKTNFRELELYVGLDLLRLGYQRANSTVHGGALATLTRISLGTGVDGTTVPPAYGCEVAASYAAASLSMTVADLCTTTENADLLAMSIIVQEHAEKVREQIARIRTDISNDSPRAKILTRKAMQRQSQGKSRRAARRR
jgi:hypothetical protein